MSNDIEDLEDEIIVKDSNGTRLQNGDNIQAIKDLKVKGTSFVIKRGEIIRGIYLTEDEKLVQGNSNKLKNLLLEVQYFKKA